MYSFGDSLYQPTFSKHGSQPLANTLPVEGQQVKNCDVTMTIVIAATGCYNTFRVRNKGVLSVNRTS